MKAIDRIKEQFISEEELANLFNVDPKRIRDLRSHHMRGKQRFIDHYKPSGKSVLYRYEDVLEWIEQTDVCTFGKTEDCEREDIVSD